ncbi:uncharacterized protein LOC117178437 [Belonocnema kinseyi]|uniref:uncharacterized protein LOC117178437 n=1 Tax=Belonocnema kinseyi TaxID=2817044 RepID=UPI00143DB4C1|nr:uncharacterized protein LOC117178437 [Belonocnema kinseyi]
MFLSSSLLVFFLDFLLKNVECSVISYQVKNSKTTQERKKRETINQSNSSNWIKPISDVNQDLLNVQAIIAKDEKMKDNCMTGSQNTENRHLMCAGSILTDRHILTSASCMHEATHIRHNLKAPLVVVIAPLKPDLQVIRVHSYKVHPKHDIFPEVYPHNHLHIRHNIAVIKLACSIKPQHLTKIRLPKAPYTEICSSDNCMVAVLRKVGKTSLVIYDTRAKQIPWTSRKRRSIEMAEDLRNDSNTEILSANIREKLVDTSKIQETLLLFDKREAQELLPLDKLGIVISGMKNNFSFSPNEAIIQQREVLSTSGGISMATNIANQHVFQGDSDQNKRQRLFSVRASDGVQGCPQLGSPVMFDRIQAALIATSCDDRQPGAFWKYTDIYSNSEWIVGQTSDLSIQNSKIESLESDKFAVKGCSTCIYNFFIDLTGSNDGTNCSDLNRNSNHFKMCASHKGRKRMNKQNSIPKKDETSRNLQLQNPPKQRGVRQYEINGEIRNKENENVKKTQKLHEKSSKINKHLLKNDDKNLTTDIPTDYDKGVGRGPAMDFDQDFDKDFDKKFQDEFQKDLQRDFKNYFNRKYDSGIRHKFENDDNLRNIKKPIENRLRNENSGNQDHESLKENGYKNLNSSKVVETMNPQESNDYNPLSKKFRNLRKVLARIHKSIPDKNIENVFFAGQRQILPKKEISNSGQGVEHFREEKMQSIVDRQFAVFLKDRERAANKHLNTYPGFNGYFLRKITKTITMGLKLLLLLLLLVMRYSLSQNVDNGPKVDDRFFKRSTNANLYEESIFENSVENFSYIVHENKQKEKLRGSIRDNFVEVNPSERNDTMLNSRNRQDMQTVLTKKFLSDPRFKEILKSERDLNFLTTWLMNRKQSIVGKPEKSDRKRIKRRRSKLCTVSGNELPDKVIENPASFSKRTKPNLKKRVKRKTDKFWIEKDVKGYDEALKMHAFIVRDEEVPECGSAASKITNTRYFMCSGVILNSRYVLTTATCIHYAHVYENHIDATISVLIGAVSKTTYVIKADSYEMHPKFIHNPDAQDFATHNVAIITMDCNIPKDALFMPKLPSKYEDLAHSCCSGSCKLLTVRQTPKNRHKILLMDAKHIPAADHYDDENRNRRETSTFVRKIKKENRKTATPPEFFYSEPEKNNLKPATSSRRQSDKINNFENESVGEGLGELSQKIMVETHRSNFDDEPIPVPANMTAKNEKSVDNFVKDISEKAVEQINRMLTDEESKNRVLPGISETGAEMVDQIAQTVAKSVMSNLNLTRMSTVEMLSNSLADPDAKYYNCPPLGSPIIVNKTLIGLVVYTCDDLQSWVPWKYVDVVRNLKWIKKVISYIKESPRSRIPFGEENRIDSPDTIHGNYQGQNSWSKIDDNKSPRVAVNKCFLNGDGTVFCENQGILPGN